MEKFFKDRGLSEVVNPISNSRFVRATNECDPILSVCPTEGGFTMEIVKGDRKFFASYYPKADVYLEHGRRHFQEGGVHFMYLEFGLQIEELIFPDHE